MIKLYNIVQQVTRYKIQFPNKFQITNLKFFKYLEFGT